MLATETPFPYPGSRGFEIVSCRPVTILQHCRTRGVLVRRDDVPPPGEAVCGTAEGNCRIELADLVATRDEAAAPAKPRRTRRRRSK